MAAPDFSAAFNAIAGLSVSGVTIYSMSNRPDNPTGRECPCLLPINSTSGGEEPESMGLAGSALYQARFTLSYSYLHCPWGAWRNGYSGYEYDLAFQKLTAIISAIKAADTTLVNIERATLSSMSDLGEVTRIDSPKNVFLGCEISFNIWQIDQ